LEIGMTKRDQVIAFMSMCLGFAGGIYLLVWALNEEQYHISVAFMVFMAGMIPILSLSEKYRRNAEAECSRLRGELEAVGLSRS
jgi:predicted membrane channel-forming protein YqfA (hemolysin III family)